MASNSDTNGVKYKVIDYNINVIVYELNVWFEHWTFAKQNMLCNTQFILNIYICIKGVFFSFCIGCLSFYKSELSLNYSTFDQLEFVKIQNFESNDVIVKSYDVISLL